MPWIIAAVAAICTGREGLAQRNAWYEGFEGPDVSWRVVGGNAQYRIERHQRTRGSAHTGEGCEELRIAGDGGTEVFLGHDVGRPRVIDELLPTVWIKADRPGIQLALQVVLPRTTDPRTQRALSTVLYGSTYTMVGRWQQLRVEEVPALLTRQVRVVRTQIGPDVDPREAYVERVLLNAYGGPGVTNVAIDDLDIAGHVGPPQGTLAPRSDAPLAGPPSRPSTGPSPERVWGNTGSPQSVVRLSEGVLRLDERPMFPRIIQYQGEPLEFLRQLGFNTVWLSQLPTTEMLEEAGRLGMWIVCPPPYMPQPEPRDGIETPLPEIGPAFDRVLAWDLGTGLGAQQLKLTTRWARQIRAADRRRSGRPLVCRPASELRAYSRCVEPGILILGRSPLGTSLELSDYGNWIRQRPRLMLLGSPIWTTVQTQPCESLRQQWAVLGQGETPPAVFPSEQIRLLVYTAVTAGSRGLLFESFSPLSAADADTRHRALTLELLNLELDLVEPWAANGNVVTTVIGAERDTTVRPDVTATLLQTEHGRLLVPLWSASRSQFVAGQSAAHQLAFRVPVPETNKAYLMLPGELRPFQPPRKAGGVRVTIEEFDLTALVLLTQNPVVVSGMSRRAVQTGRRAAEIQRELAAIKLQTVSQLARRLAVPNPHVRQAAEWLKIAEQQLHQCDAQLAARAKPEAYLCAQRAMRPLRLLEREHWNAATATLCSPVASPAAVTFATLPWHWTLMERVAASQPVDNLLPGGEFEDLRSLFETGWEHIQHPVAGIESVAELAPAAAHAGRSGLRLAVRGPQGSDSPLVESPPVWIASPAVPVEAGELVRIQGWVNVPKPIAGSVDGLLITDSLGGEPLALRIARTSGWELFTLYRVAPQQARVGLSFALTGIGEAMIDDVTIQPLRPAPAAAQNNYELPLPVRQ